MQNSRQAIVFGGAGFIGTHLLGKLASSREYERLVSLDIQSPRTVVDGVEYINHDVRDPIDPKLAKGMPADIFNLAAVHTTPGHPEGDYYYTNVFGALNVCRFASETGSNSLTFTSSISIYGPTEEVLDEDDRPKPVSAYGRSKLSAEGIHRLWQSEGSGRRLTIVRPAVIYGLYEHGNFTRLSRLLQKHAFVFPGRSDTIKSCGYVKDLISSMQFMAARNDGVSIYNFCYEQRYTINEICSAFAQVAGYRDPKLTIPIWVMNLAVLPFEFLQKTGIRTGINRDRVKKLWFSTNILPKRLVESGFQFQHGLLSSLEDWKSASQIKDFD
ncbi:NAD-dependent epimerase/dehydratase family protein [Bradyrhizobium sp. SSUT112]|uniref:NAD-dependent epimerase/dehydratase family protein n=1 Tax=Bradyrhizobium sp. SSUT112 TaxID=3040604 RepID=UPI00244AE758|nr:NAD-dependent epimerase/dehydratase family protein [Bradyrhizobium sp. SSUT112]MDH2356825.1 NAD-dependent epimerase/dehydratase family protein [Bradyrhizobium sp. SSUT112]